MLNMLSNASVDIVLMLITSCFKISDMQNQLSTFTIWQKIIFKVSIVHFKNNFCCYLLTPMSSKMSTSFFLQLRN